MLKDIQEIMRPLTMLCCLVVGACGGGNGSTDMSRVLQESELYNPITHPAGVTEQPGQTAVLGVQANVSDLPPPQNAPNKGVEDLWFEVQDAQPVQFALDADMQATVDRVEIRDVSNTLFATISAGAPVLTLALTKGRYQALVYASAAATAPAPVFVQYGAAASSVQGAQSSERVQAQAQYTINIKNTSVDLLKSYVIFQPSCTQCNLQGHMLSAWKMVGHDFHSTSFANANLNWADLYQAKLQDTSFTSAALSNANFQGADLSGANFTGANLTGTLFTNANLSNAIWVDGVKRCAPGSIGVCR